MSRNRGDSSSIAKLPPQAQAGFVHRVSGQSEAVCSLGIRRRSGLCLPDAARPALSCSPAFQRRRAGQPSSVRLAAGISGHPPRSCRVPRLTHLCRSFQFSPAISIPLRPGHSGEPPQAHCHARQSTSTQTGDAPNRALWYFNTTQKRMAVCKPSQACKRPCPRKLATAASFAAVPQKPKSSAAFPGGVKTPTRARPAECEVPRLSRARKPAKKAPATAGN